MTTREASTDSGAFLDSHSPPTLLGTANQQQATQGGGRGNFSGFSGAVVGETGSGGGARSRGADNSSSNNNGTPRAPRDRYRPASAGGRGGGGGADLIDSSVVGNGAIADSFDHEDLDIGFPNTPSRNSDAVTARLMDPFQHSNSGGVHHPPENPFRAGSQGGGGSADEGSSSGGNGAGGTNRNHRHHQASSSGAEAEEQPFRTSNEQQGAVLSSEDDTNNVGGTFNRLPPTVQQSQQQQQQLPAAFQPSTTEVNAGNGGGAAAAAAAGAGGPAVQESGAEPAQPAAPTAQQIMADLAEERRRIAVQAAQAALAAGATPAQAVAAGVAAANAHTGGAAPPALGTPPPPQSPTTEGGANRSAQNTVPPTPAEGGGGMEVAASVAPTVATATDRHGRPRVPNSDIVARPRIHYSKPLKTRQAVLLDSQWMLQSPHCALGECASYRAMFLSRCLIADNCQRFYDEDEDCCRWLVVDHPRLFLATLCLADVATAGAPFGCFYHGCGTAVFGCWSRWMVRRRYRIEGFGWQDFLMMSCCVSCASAQMIFERDHNMIFGVNSVGDLFNLTRGSDGVGGVGGGAGSAFGGMLSSPNTDIEMR